MMKKKAIVIISVSLGVVVMISLVLKCLDQYQPIRKTNQWEATVTYSGITESVNIYKMSDFPDRLLLKLPENTQQGKHAYEWFGISKHGVSELYGVKTFPYRHYNHDMAFGLSLEDPKIEDNWTIEWNGEDVQFANDYLKISVKKKP